MKLYTPALKAQLDGEAARLSERVETKEAIIGVAGLGYVGLPIALEFAKRGFKCIGVDVDIRKIDALKKGENYIEDLKDEEVADVVERELLHASADYEVLQEADVIYICVPTPFNANKDPDISYILSASEAIAEIMHPGKLVIIKSTTFPGTTENHIIPRLNKSGLSAGKDYFIAFSPERVDPGNKIFHTANTPIVVGGIDESSSILASAVNNEIIEKIYMVGNPKVAELEKLLENIFRSVNIALVNELALLCERMGGIDVWEVIESASTKPFGFMKFTPGPGVGGHCIPIDPYYLSWLAREYDFETKFVTLAANVNESMPYHVCNLAIRQIARQPITLEQARVLIMGVSFKKNVKDLRHSPSEAIIHRLIEEGIQNIDYNDPWAPTYNVAGRTLYSIELTPESLASYNCVILITDHDDFDIPFITQHATHIVDTRNMTGGIENCHANIVRLGHAPPKPKLVLEH